MSYSLSHQGQTVNNFPVSLISSAEGGGGGGGVLPLVVIPNGAYANNLAMGITSTDATEIDPVTDGFYGNSGYATLVDLTGMSQVRLIARFETAGPTGAYLKYKYSTDDITYADLKSGGFQVAADATGWVDSGWQALVAGAKALVYLHPYTGNGNDGSNFANALPLTLFFK